MRSRVAPKVQGAVAASGRGKASTRSGGIQDLRPQADVRSSLQQAVDGSPRVAQLQSMQRLANGGAVGEDTGSAPGAAPIEAPFAHPIDAPPPEADETPAQLHERLGRAAQAILSQPPSKGMSPAQALAERRRLARQLEAYFSEQLEPGIGMFITVDAGPDPRRSNGLEITILIAPNDWKTRFKIAAGLVMAGTVLYWMWRGGRGGGGGQASGRAQATERQPLTDRQSPVADAGPIDASIRGLPNQDNDCFLNSIIQLLAGAYPALLTANDSMRTELRAFVRAHNSAITPDTCEAEVDALRDALSVDAPDFGALVGTHGPDAANAEQAQAQLRAIHDRRGASLRMRGRLLSLIQRVNDVDGAPIGPHEVQELRAQLVENGILAGPAEIGGPAAQEDAHEVLGAILDLFAPPEGNRIEVGKRVTIVSSEPAPEAEHADVADFAHGVLARPEAPEPTLLVPLAGHDDLISYLNDTFGGDGVEEEADMRARNDGVGVHITRQRVASRFTRLPQVMTIVLQRSLPDGRKEGKRFGMPERLTLLEGDPPVRRKRYRLTSVVYHQGGGRGGHYWAHRRHMGQWQLADDRVTRVDRQPGGEAGERDLPHDVNHGYVYSYVLEEDQPCDDGGQVATGADFDATGLPPPLAGGGTGTGHPSTRRGTSTAPRSTSVPELGVTAPIEAPVRLRGVDEEPLVISEVMAAAAKLGDLGIRPLPPSTLVLRDPRLPSRKLSIEVVVTDPGTDGDPMWVGPGEAHPQLMVSNRADLSDARDWFAMAIDRIRQGALAGLRYKAPIAPTRAEPEPLGGTRVVKDQLIDRDAEPRHVSTVHATLASWLPDRIGAGDEDDRLLNVTVAYAAQLEMTQPAAANLVLALSELWLSFNPGLVNGEDDLIRPLVRHLWQQLTPLAAARVRQRSERIDAARVIPEGERKTRMGKQPEVQQPDLPKALPTALPTVLPTEVPEGGDDDFLFGYGLDDESTPEPVDPRTRLEPAYLMEDGYRTLHAVLADENAGAHAKALLKVLQETPGNQIKQVAYQISERLRRRDAPTTPSIADGTADGQADSRALDEATRALEPLGVTPPKVGEGSGAELAPAKAKGDADPFHDIFGKLNNTNVRAVCAEFLEAEDVPIDLGNVGVRVRKTRVQKTLPVPAEIEAATESFFISPADAEMLQRLLGFHTATRLISYYRSNNAIVSIRALVGQLRKLAPTLAEAAWPPLTDTSLVLDTNVVKALLLKVEDLSSEERAVQRKALALITHLRPADLRLPNMVLGELSAFGPGVMEQLSVAVQKLLGLSAPIPCYGVPIDGARDNASREGKYASDLIAMEEAQVGGGKGAPDRGLVADTMHATRSQQTEHRPDSPTRLMTADLGIAKHLRENYSNAVLGSHGDEADPYHFTTAKLNGNVDVFPIDIPAEFEIHGRPALPSADLGGFVPPPQVDLAPLQPPAGLAREVFMRPVGPVSRDLHVYDLIALIRSGNGQVVVTGGAVRDAVHGDVPNDVDLTCTLKLAQLDALLQSHDRFNTLGRELVRLRGLRLLKLSNGNNPIDITCADEGEDKTLDTEGLAHDATKRDFRMNALYFDHEGNLHDPTGEGVADALQKRLVLVADKFFGDLSKSEDPPFEEIGRSFKFVGRDYRMPEEQQALLRQAYLALIERARGQDATEVADTVRMLEKAREKTPVEIMQTMTKLGFSDRAIRALFPDSVAGLAADRTPAFERNVVPRRLDNPKTEDDVVPGAAPQVKIDDEHGGVYQYRVFARTEDPEERLMIDIDFTDHDLPGHRAQHHHIYRWKASSRTWDKHIAGLSKTGQPGRPDLDGDLYRGPRPWLVEEALSDGEVDAKTLVEQLNKGLKGFSYHATVADGLVDLGGELLLHPAKVRQMQVNGTLRLVFMLVENIVTHGKMPPPQDESLDELTKTGGERLRFHRHLADVDMMLKALGVDGEALFANIPVAGKIRLYDLLVVWHRSPVTLEAAMRSALKHNPQSVEQLVELCEASLALAEQNASEPGEVLDGALQDAGQHAPGAIDGGTRDQQQAAIQVAARNRKLKFGTPSAAAYHWLKHGKELGPSGSTRETFGLDAYVAAANDAIAAAEDLSVEVEQTGATAFVFMHKAVGGDIKAVVKVADGRAQIATCFRRTPRQRPAEALRLPRPEALERLGVVTTLVKPEQAPRADQMERLVAALEEEVAKAVGADAAPRRLAIRRLVDWADARVDVPGVASDRVEGWRKRLAEVRRLAVA
ncbi:hypothetical protein [Massilia rhizosphaerae]|uniref:hypothetical protein n=1 Tax=Massilia rhizosphaerae TaxID=2784389 RepID=UPI0018DCD0DB|nr:hypothetical protein [Massilia rhizosphaerae]